ncbi:hypothetical protein RirG_153410 [Rhizophagus irregularis DAOM 197198w]|uniref:Zinc finger bed domain-containing protein 1-like n=1 Tax=Rhizophagus irregularis (strain DAOM 197198w) TaxID=1432141 RepID=A0A015M8Y2_RHIIW|nr:hypothetical protein RirG_153410 [Rhizophagus irregularis DAOM 197198w]
MAEFDPAFVIPGEKKFSSQSKHSYLEITAVWIIPIFEIKDVMLEIEYIPAPHISEMIANSFYKFISSWNLRNRITSITIDNGANMVAAVRSLKEKSGCINIQHMPCASHTLQLAIGKGLAYAEALIARAKKLI